MENKQLKHYNSISNAKCKMQNAKCKMQNAKCKMRNSVWKISNQNTIKVRGGSMRIKMQYRDRDITVTEKNKMFYRKDKKLTVYSFNCGYIEVYQSTDETVKVSIEKYGCYHVKLYQDKPEFLGHFSRWECFNTLTEARKYCGALLKAIQKIEIPEKGKS